MTEVLEIAKEDFLALTAGYVDSAKGMKGPLLALIQEFCDKKGIRDCFILTWGEAEEGKEDEGLRRDVHTFKVFTKFCDDLAGFLEAMARSCPKAKKLFVAMIERAKQDTENKKTY